MSTFKVIFGTASDLSDGRELASAKPALDHSVALTNLLPGTVYYYQVTLTDVSGNESEPKAGSFSTLAEADEDPPIILTGPIAVSITDQGARIEFATDEDVDAVLELSLIHI